MRVILSLILTLFLALPAAVAAQEAAPDATVPDRAVTGGAPTLEDILARQRGEKVDDSARRAETGDPDSAAAMSQQLGTLGGASDPDLWRAIRFDSADVNVSAGGDVAKVLVQEGGMSWQAFRSGPLSKYGGWLLLGEAEVSHMRPEQFDVRRFGSATFFQKPPLQATASLPDEPPRPVLPIDYGSERATGAASAPRAEKPAANVEKAAREVKAIARPSKSLGKHARTSKASAAIRTERFDWQQVEQHITRENFAAAESALDTIRAAMLFSNQAARCSIWCPGTKACCMHRRATGFQSAI